MRSVKKTVWTLNVNPSGSSTGEGYAPEITQLTYPLILAYANKIGAEFKIINERRFPKWPITYEKLQIFELGRENDWNVYIDSDAFVFPDMFDITERLPRDTVCHWGRDNASNRWQYDDYFRRDGRDIGSNNWFAAASSWCLDLWRPLDDLDCAGAVQRISPIVLERNNGITPEHLIDDYTLSRNIARFGLKFKSIQKMQEEAGDRGVYFYHEHTISLPEKIAKMRKIVEGTKILDLPQVRKATFESPLNWISYYGVAPPPVKRRHDFAGSV
jgi:hypothetical protein